MMMLSRNDRGSHTVARWFLHLNYIYHFYANLPVGILDYFSFHFTGCKNHNFNYGWIHRIGAYFPWGNSSRRSFSRFSRLGDVLSASWMSHGHRRRPSKQLGFLRLTW